MFFLLILLNLNMTSRLVLL